MIQHLMFWLFAGCCFVGYALGHNNANVAAIALATFAALVGLQLSYVVGCVMRVS